MVCHDAVPAAALVQIVVAGECRTTEESQNSNDCGRKMKLRRSSGMRAREARETAAVTGKNRPSVRLLSV